MINVVKECGNGKFEPENEEDCDDGNNDYFDGCAECRITPGWECSNVLMMESECNKICGNGLKESFNGE